MTGSVPSPSHPLMTSTDWTASPIGPPTRWPTSLRNVVDVMFGMPAPAFIVWGPQETLLYNEPFRDHGRGVAGRSQRSTGRRRGAGAAQTLQPELKVLFITGHAENAALNHGHIGPGMALLTKPFAISELARRVERMLGQS